MKKLAKELISITAFLIGSYQVVGVVGLTGSDDGDDRSRIEVRFTSSGKSLAKEVPSATVSKQGTAPTHHVIVRPVPDASAPTLYQLETGDHAFHHQPIGRDAIRPVYQENTGTPANWFDKVLRSIRSRQ